MNDAEFEKACAVYFKKLESAERVETNDDAAKARDKNLAIAKVRRTLTVSGYNLKSIGPDIVSNATLDHAVIQKFQSVPITKAKNFDAEYNFLIFKENGILKPSRHFLVQGNGGGVHYKCFLGYQFDWNTVVAAAHTHPIYKDKPSLNRQNKYFSAGDPTILLRKNIPLYLRTHGGKEIKVLEIRDNWLTTRKLSLKKIRKAYRWQAQS